MDNQQIMQQQAVQAWQQAVQAQGNQGIGAVGNVRMNQQLNGQVQNAAAQGQVAAHRAVQQAMPPVQQVHHNVPPVYRRADLATLQHTDHMGPNMIEHIFIGEINRRGKAVGYHYEGIAERRGRVISARSAPDASGVYTAQVQVDNVQKRTNGGYSTFFPRDMSPQDVADCIHGAFTNKRHIIDNLYEGEVTRGDGSRLIIQMRIDSGKITTAYPIFQGRGAQPQGGAQP